MAGLLVVISGPSSGAGKDSVTRGVEEKGDFARVVTYTTREIRPGEIDGLDYHFISREKFLAKKKAGFFLETNEYLGNLYGAPKDKVLRLIKSGRDVLLRVDVNGAKNVKKQIPEALLIFIEAPFADMKRRLVISARERGEAIKEKLAFAKKEMKQQKHFDYVVVNKERKLDETVDEVLRIIKAEKKREP